MTIAGGRRATEQNLRSSLYILEYRLWHTVILATARALFCECVHNFELEKWGIIGTVYAWRPSFGHLKKISSHIISQGPPDQHPPIWPHASPSLAMSEKPDLVFLTELFHYISFGCFHYNFSNATPMYCPCAHMLMDLFPNGNSNPVM